MSKTIPIFNVINWDFNHDCLEYYNIFPHLVKSWKEELERGFFIYSNREDKTKVPETFDEFKYFIWSCSKHQFWSRCEYEVIVTGWPVQKKQVKIDVFDQICANIDVITRLFMEYIKDCNSETQN